MRVDVGPDRNGGQRREAPSVRPSSADRDIAQSVGSEDDPETGAPFGRGPPSAPEQLDPWRRHAGERGDASRGRDESGGDSRSDHGREVGDLGSRFALESASQGVGKVRERAPGVLPGNEMAIERRIRDGHKGFRRSGFPSHGAFDPLLLAGEGDENFFGGAHRALESEVAEGKEESALRGRVRPGNGRPAPAKLLERGGTDRTSHALGDRAGESGRTGDEPGVGRYGFENREKASGNVRPTEGIEPVRRLSGVGVKEEGSERSGSFGPHHEERRPVPDDERRPHALELRE